MQGHEALMSSGDATGSYDWETPKQFFDLLDRVFGPFTLDAAATQETTKYVQYYSSNSLEQPWEDTVFCNPPYGRGVSAWIQKGFTESRLPHCKSVVMLLPARTDTVPFHDVIIPHATLVLFVRGRIQFKLIGKPNNSATFPSMVVLFDKQRSEHSVMPEFGYIIQPSAVNREGAVRW